MRKEMIGTGFGGQGIQLMIKIFASSLYNKGYLATFKSDYGPAVRGGKSSAYIVIKEFADDWPEIMEADVLIALSQQGFDFWIKEIKQDAIVFYDPATVKLGQKDGRKYYAVFASEIANDLEDKRAVNMAMLGGVVKITKMIVLDDIIEALKQTRKFSETNQKALEQGYDRVERKTN